MITWWQIGNICGELARTGSPDDDGFIRGFVRERDFLPLPWRNMKPIPVPARDGDYTNYLPPSIPQHVIKAQRQAIKDFTAGFQRGRNDREQ